MTVPVKLLAPAVATTVRVEEPVQLKQYQVPAVNWPLGKVTLWLLTLVAVAILGQAVAAVESLAGSGGQLVLVVPTVQLAGVLFKVKLDTEGKVTLTVTPDALVVVAGFEQTVPVEFSPLAARRFSITSV